MESLSGAPVCRFSFSGLYTFNRCRRKPRLCPAGSIRSLSCDRNRLPAPGFPFPAAGEAPTRQAFGFQVPRHGVLRRSPLAQWRATSTANAGTPCLVFKSIVTPHVYDVFIVWQREPLHLSGLGSALKTELHRSIMGPGCSHFKGHTWSALWAAYAQGNPLFVSPYRWDNCVFRHSIPSHSFCRSTPGSRDPGRRRTVTYCLASCGGTAGEF